MKLVVDTNILISALIRDSITRAILLLPFFEFLLPEYAIDEIEHHKGKISELSGLSPDEIDILLEMLLEFISIVPAEQIASHLKKAQTIIGHIDPGDIPFVALALAIRNDGIWSHDKHFEKIKGIKIWKTSDILKYLERL